MRRIGKRKLPILSQSEQFQWNFVDLATVDIHSVDVDFVVNKIIDEIRNGTHSSVTHREISLQIRKKKIINAADRHRKFQIVNINHLYEYEVEDANAQYEVIAINFPPNTNILTLFSIFLFQRARRETENELIEEVMVEKQRLINLQQQLHTQQSNRTKVSISSDDYILESSEPTSIPMRALRSSINSQCKSDNNHMLDDLAGGSRGSNSRMNKKPGHYFEKSLSRAEVKFVHLPRCLSCIFNCFFRLLDQILLRY